MMNINYDKVFDVENCESKHSKLFPPNIFMVMASSTGGGKTNLLCNILLKYFGKSFKKALQNYLTP